jgi:hypothetical protein
MSAFPAPNALRRKGVPFNDEEECHKAEGDRQPTKAKEDAHKLLKHQHQPQMT